MSHLAAETLVVSRRSLNVLSYKESKCSHAISEQIGEYTKISLLYGQHSGIYACMSSSTV